LARFGPLWLDYDCEAFYFLLFVLPPFMAAFF